jgi:hypothetical protein
MGEHWLPSQLPTASQPSPDLRKESGFFVFGFKKSFRREGRPQHFKAARYLTIWMRLFH